ncbi:MAG: cation diffusion facilitator family transporter [Pseudomonadota bacterium]
MAADTVLSPESADRGATLSKTAAAASVVVAVSLVIAKAVAWRASGSVGVLASLADSALDLAASGVAAVGVWFAARPADDNHRFGHGKGEAAAALVQSVLIAVSVVLITAETIAAMIAPQPLAAERIAIGVMAGSLAAILFLVAVQSLAIRREGSLAVEADRAHYLGDILSQAGVLAALAATVWLDAPRLDAVAGGLVAITLGYAAISISRKALGDLLDEELPDTEREEITKIALAASGASNIHDVRTRRSGRRLFVQMHLDFPGGSRLGDVHEAGERARRAILETHPEADVLIHHDPV